MTETLIPLAAFAFVASITPGPNNLMLMASGANFGVLRTLPHAAGVCIGFTVMLVALGLGLAQLFQIYPPIHWAMKIGCAIYLLYLAWNIANAAPVSNDTEQAVTARPMTFLQACAFQWINPKAWYMGMTAIAAFTTSQSSLLSVMLVALVFGLVNLPCITCWMMAGSQIRRFLNSHWRLRAFNITAAMLLALTLWPLLAG